MGRGTGPGGWTTIEERFCAHHADAGVLALAELFGREPRDVINHMGALGYEVPPIPSLGTYCPSCGQRMPVRGSGFENGVCDACWTRRLMERRRGRFSNSSNSQKRN